ncbi:hypothetical protein ACWDUB_14380 [Streptomyces fungicidicus]
MVETNAGAQRLTTKSAPRLVASPFLAQYLLVQPGRAAGVRIPEVRYEELRTAGAEGRSVPDWLADAARDAWGTELPSPFRQLRDAGAVTTEPRAINAKTRVSLAATPPTSRPSAEQGALW